MVVGRLDRVVTELERLQKDADDIINTFVDQIMHDQPRGASWGVTKHNKIMAPAGSTLDRVAALRMVRDILVSC